MEQRYQEQMRTESKQYGPKVEAVLSGILVAVGIAVFVVYSIV